MDIFNRGVREMGSKNRKHLIWIYQRLESIHRENINSDYMIKFKEIIDDMTKKERHDQQVNSSPLCGPDVMKTVEAVNELRSEWNIEGMPKQNYTPQVGEECEFQSFIGNDWIKGVLIASTESYAILKSDKREHSFIKENVNFRPLKTERDKLLEQAVSNFSESELAIEENIKATCYRLIDAGWRPTNDY